MDQNIMMDQNRRIKEELKLIEEEYIIYKSLSIYCGTYNVNGKLPDESLSSWLCLNNNKQIDIYALGFQELVDLTTANLLLKNDSNEQIWLNYVETELLNEKNFKTKTKYIQLTKMRMFGLFLVIYVDKSLLKHIPSDEILKANVATGIMDLVGNKGSLGISLKVYDSRLCFICSHFAADTDKIEKRNSDYRSARLKLNFQNELNQINYLNLDDHDAIFWFGDLNYRIDKLTLTETLKHITANNYEELIKYDQLVQEKNKKNIFEDYSEGKINFRPTYKYKSKTDIYEKQDLVTKSETNSTDNEANRIGKIKLPSWTDRVFWKSSNLKCNILQYSSINTITISDHKPVYGLFEIEVKKRDEQKYTKLCNSLLDKKINDEMPHISLKSFEFNFGECLFYDTKRLEMIVKNEGMSRSNVDIIYHENSDDNEKKDSNQWVTIMPQHKKRFEPNSSYIVELRTCFNYKMLNRLLRQKKLDDFLIVRCLNGNDSFATISCEYKPTLIGISLKGLSSLKADESFESCDKVCLIDSIEKEIDDYENSLNVLFRNNLKVNTASYQLENFNILLNNNDMKNFDSELSKSVLDQKIQVYHKTFSALNVLIKNDDKYFSYELSSEYKFLLEYLIKKCTNDSDSLESNNAQSGLTIEEQKNFALVSLSSKNYDEFKSFNFDLELLAELLYDLLYALPQSLIPSRYIDYCWFILDKKDQVNLLFDYMPKSHRQLFELIVKFLKTYLKLLSTTESNYSNMISEAIFQLDKYNSEKNKNDIKEVTCQKLNAYKFLKLFIDN